MTPKQMINECYDLAVMLCKQSDQETEEDIERRYKIIVMMILPRLFGLMRALLFLLSPLAGFFLFLFIKALTM